MNGMRIGALAGGAVGLLITALVGMENVLLVLVGMAAGGLVGYWTEKGDTVSWSALVEPGRRYRVELDHGCQPGSEGGVLAVEVDGTTLEYRISRPTKSWHDYRVVAIGELTAGEAAEVAVTVRCRRIAKDALVNLRWIRLVPVR